MLQSYKVRDILMKKLHDNLALKLKKIKGELNINKESKEK